MVKEERKIKRKMGGEEGWGEGKSQTLLFARVVHGRVGSPVKPEFWTNLDNNF